MFKSVLFRRITYSVMLRRVVLVITDVSEESSASVIRVTIKSELETTFRPLLVTARVLPSSPIVVTLMMEALGSSETFVHIRARRNIS
jgi:hypothetical protein